MPKRTKKVKAEARTWEFRNAYGHYCGEELVWTLPRTPEAYDAMVEQMAAAIGTHSYKRCQWAEIPETSKPYYRNEASAALRAIGITRPEDGK